MTLHVADVASYQGTLTAAAVQRAGFSVVNLKISHGLGQKSVHPDLTTWVLDARRLGLGISTFHYLTAQAAGADQAEYAYAQLERLGLINGTAHQMDTEADAGWDTIRAYAERMQQLLDRPIALYTGDWWWTAPARRWAGASATPYLWAAPNSGYLPAYPGDSAAAWAAGYGGWAELAVMQYAVGPLPGGTVKVSKSAIRDPATWRDLTYGRPGMTFAPDSLADDRRFLMAHLTFTDGPGSVGIVGDDNHQQTGSSYHLGKSANKPDSYSIVESPRDRKGLTEAASALDVGRFSVGIGGRTHNLRTFSVWLVDQCERGAADTLDIREVIYSPDGTTVKRWDRLKHRTTGDSGHRTHTHLSRFRDAQNRGFTPLFTRYFISIGLIEEDPLAGITLDNIGDEFDRRMRSAVAFAGPAGTRLGQAGWTDKSRDEWLTRLFEGVLGSTPLVGPDGTASEGSALVRLARVEARQERIEAMLVSLGATAPPPTAGS